MPISLNHEPSPHIGSRSQKSGPHAWQGPTLAAVRTQNSSDHDGTALVVNLVCLRNDTYAVGSMAVLDGCVAGADDTVMTESSAPEPAALPGPGVSLASTCFSQASPPSPVPLLPSCMAPARRPSRCPMHHVVAAFWRLTSPMAAALSKLEADLQLNHTPPRR
jgi:hypothetical protein